jgi:hypothetical protein
MAAKWDGYSADYSVSTMAASRAVQLAALLAHRKVGRTEYLLVAWWVYSTAAESASQRAVMMETLKAGRSVVLSATPTADSMDCLMADLLAAMWVVR